MTLLSLKDQLIHYVPEIFKKIVIDLIRKDKIKIRKIFIFDELVQVNLLKLDYSLMDEFSIRLFNHLYYSLGGLNIDDDLISIKQ
ncbi:MAG: hypothetical protein ACFFAI_09915 [Promethearchaeota archaeon]